MTRYRKLPVEIDATQWFHNGDHPKDESQPIATGDSKAFWSEGKIVRRFIHPGVNGAKPCDHCGIVMRKHGWIDTLEGGHIVCPGDFIITGVKGENYPCKPDIFAATYEEVK
jgi:hypothetical protein